MDNERLKKLKEVLKLVSEGLTREEFTASFKAVIKQILEIEKKLITLNTKKC